MMKRIVAMFVTAVMISALCACDASSQVVEDKKSICAALTNIRDWSAACQVMNEVVSTRKADALKYEPHGAYNLTGYNSKVYTFDGANSFYEVVCFDENESHIIIIHNTGDHGVSFWSGIRKEAKFCGLTQNYVLYIEDAEVIAVSIAEREDCKIGEYTYDVIPFDELPIEEQNTAIYPTGSYINQF